MTNEKNKITAYDIIAICLGLQLVKDRTWKDKWGKTFILTKFGFETYEKYHARKEHEKMKKQIEELQYELVKQNRLRKEEEDKYLSAKLKLMELEEKMNQRSAA